MNSEQLKRIAGNMRVGLGGLGTEQDYWDFLMFDLANRNSTFTLEEVKSILGEDFFNKTLEPVPSIEEKEDVTGKFRTLRRLETGWYETHLFTLKQLELVRYLMQKSFEDGQLDSLDKIGKISEELRGNIFDT